MNHRLPYVVPALVMIHFLIFGCSLECVQEGDHLSLRFLCITAGSIQKGHLDITCVSV